MKSMLMVGFAVVSLFACAPAEEGEDVLGGPRAAAGGARGSGGAKSVPSTGGQLAIAAGGNTYATGTGGAAPLSTSGGVGGASLLPTSGGAGGTPNSLSLNGGAGAAATLLSKGGAGSGGGLLIGSGGSLFGAGGSRNNATSQGGFPTSDPDSDTHVDLDGDGWIDFGGNGEGGATTSIDWG